jgi:hypothetical protein
MEQFKDEIEKRFLLSVANKFYSFPYSELAFDNPVEDREIQGLAEKTLYCLYADQEDSLGERLSQGKKEVVEQKESVAKTALQ